MIKPRGLNSTGEHLTVRAGLVLPLTQAFVTGMFTSCGAWAIGLLSGWKHAPAIAATVGALTMLITWLILLRGWRVIVAAQAGVDLNPPPPVQPKTTMLEMAIGDDRNTLRYAELPASEEQLRTLARGVLEGATISEATWTPGLFTRSEFARLKAAMVRRGLAANRSRDPARGIQLTRPGESAFRWLADLGNPPTDSNPTRPQ